MRVLIAEDSVLLRAGLTRLLIDAGLDVIASVGDASALVDAAERLQPDLAVIDVRMPPTNTDDGLRAALDIRARWPKVGILMLSQYVEERYATELLAHDTSGLGYLLRDRIADVGDFLAAVHRVAEGGTALDPEVVTQLLARSRRRDPLASLSPREREVSASWPPACRTPPSHMPSSSTRARSKSTFRTSSPSSTFPPPTAATAGCSPSCAGSTPRRRHERVNHAIDVDHIRDRPPGLDHWRQRARRHRAGVRHRAARRRPPRDTTTERQVFPAEGVRLVDVGLPNGSIEVRGAETNEISLVAEIDHGLRRTRHRAGIEGGVLRVRASCPALGTWCEVDYRLVVPSGMAVSADANNGRLIVRDVTGTVRADGDNGSIELTRLSGELDVSTDNGRVQSSALTSEHVVARTRNGQVRLEFARPPLHVEAASANGRVDVVVPRTTDACVDLDTDNGSTDVAVRTDPSSRRSVEARTNNGDVTVRYPSS